jgi:hypothetical protein
MIDSLSHTFGADTLKRSNALMAELVDLVEENTPAIPVEQMEFKIALALEKMRFDTQIEILVRDLKSLRSDNE